MKETSLQPPIVIELQFDNKPVKCELDTGATVSVMSSAVFKSTFPEM